MADSNLGMDTPTESKPEVDTPSQADGAADAGLTSGLTGT
jgi:hypothetical protein